MLRTLEINGEVETFSTKEDAIKAKNIYNRVIAKARITLYVELGLTSFQSYQRKMRENISAEKWNEYKMKDGIKSPQEQLEDAFTNLEKAKKYLKLYKGSFNDKIVQPSRKDS